MPEIPRCMLRQQENSCSRPSLPNLISQLQAEAILLQVATLSQAWPLSAQAGATRFKLLFDLNTFTSVSFCKLELPCFKLHPFLTIQAWPLPSPLTGKLEPIRSKLLMYQILGHQIPNHNIWQAGTCGSQVVHFIFSCLCKLGLSRSKLFQISSYPPTSPFDVYSLLTLYPSLLALPEVWIHRV